MGTSGGSERVDAVTGRSEVTPAKPRSSEIHPGLGFRIRRNIARPAADLVARYRRFDTPDVSDLMNRLYTMSPDIKNLITMKKS